MCGLAGCHLKTQSMQKAVVQGEAACTLCMYQKPRQHTRGKDDPGKLLISVVYMETYNDFEGW